MSRTGLLSVELTETWTYALLGGFLSLPLTAVGYWQTGSELSLSPVVLGGLVAGYLAARRTGTSRGVGVRAGLVGALPAVWMGFDIVGAGSELAGPAWFTVAGGVLVAGAVVVVVVVAFCLAALAGESGARLGGWLARSNGAHRPPGVEN